MSDIVTFYVYATGLTYIVLCGVFWWRETTQREKLADAVTEASFLRQELAKCRTDRDTLEIVLGDAVRLIKSFEKERVVMVDVAKPKQ